MIVVHLSDTKTLPTRFGPHCCKIRHERPWNSDYINMVSSLHTKDKFPILACSPWQGQEFHTATLICRSAQPLLLVPIIHWVEQTQDHQCIVVAALRSSHSGLAGNEPLLSCKGADIGTPPPTPTLRFGENLPRADEVQHVSFNENSFRQ